MVSSTLSIGSRKVIKCNTCNLQTRHELKAIHTRHDEEEYDSNNPSAQPSWWVDYEYRFWGCLGCDTAVLEEAITPYTEDTYSVFYPNRKGERLDIKNFIRLDDKLLMFKELISV